jgi:hypothetical protein
LKSWFCFRENGAQMMRTAWQRPALILAAAIPFLACNAGKLTVRRTRDGQQLSSYHVQSLTGLRDGDQFRSELVVGDRDGVLTMQMQFRIGVPTKFDSGSYVWKRKDAPEIQGSVRAAAVTFQGGQDGPPSLGGTFQLVSDDVSLYEVKLPATHVDAPGKTPLPTPPLMPAPARAEPTSPAR